MKKRLSEHAPFILVLLIAVPILLLIFVQTVDAQCGASASSCKNCHEVNAEYPVNTSGDWHISHSFGDFCVFCHAGNVQSNDQDAAHEGMIYPLEDPQGSCQSCHPSDYQEQAEVYARVLGVTLGGTDSAGGGTNNDAGGGNAVDVSTIPSEPIEPPGERNASGALVDYNRRYEIEVLGMLDTSQIGNLILVISGILLAVLGFVLLWHFEKWGEAWRKAREVPDAENWRKLAYSGGYSVSLPAAPIVSSASAPVAAPPAARVELPQELRKLDDKTQSALSLLLAREQGPAVLQALARLDPTLIQSLQALDQKDRDLLLAVVEQLGANKS